MLSSRQMANAIRALAMDAVQKANSGHPGMPMGMADIAQVLWCDYLKHNPKNPAWPNRDRFVLSNGHGVMLHYALLYLTGYDLTIEDIQAFRQLHAKTPGHPEYGQTPGIEATTGPLAQGLGAAVGMAIAAKQLAAEFNQDDYELINHWVYCFVGDGCLMEGLSHEVASLAGLLGLNRLIVFWDDNGVSIDGKTALSFQEDIPARFEAYGWSVIRDLDGHNALAIQKAIADARKENERPTLLCCKTTIGFGAPNLAGQATIHGSPLGEEEIALAKKALDWPYQPFDIPKEILASYNAEEIGEQQETYWRHLLEDYGKKFPKKHAAFMRRLSQALPASLEELLLNYAHAKQMQENKLATRQASQKVIQLLHQHVPELLGGSADLSTSTLTWTDQAKVLNKDNFQGNYLHYGVREFGMSTIMNGIALYGAHIPFGGTFLVFSDYARNAVRMSAMMKKRVIYVYSHDSVAVGEDGPTHQPIEHLSSLRAIPNVFVWRPCDEVETALAWQCALQRQQGPTILALSRQSLLPKKRVHEQVENILKGGYILADSDGDPECILIATGSEVGLALDVKQALVSMNIRVVSMPCVELFLAQPAIYQASVLPKQIKKRLAIEAGACQSWYRFVGLEGGVIGVNHFGFSAPGQEALTACEITVEATVKKIKELG